MNNPNTIQPDPEMFQPSPWTDVESPLLETLRHVKRRLETIRETDPDIALDDDIALANAAILEATGRDTDFGIALGIAKVRGELTPSMLEEWAEEIADLAHFEDA